MGTAQADGFARRAFWAVVAAALCLAAAVALAGENRARAAEPLTVVATVAQIGVPLARIAGDRAEVVSLMGPGVDPHLYRPTRSDVAQLAGADLIVVNGSNLEAQMNRAFDRLEGKIPVIRVAEAVAPDARIMAEEGYPDPHVWMDPALWVGAMATAVDALAEADPDGADIYRRNFAAWAAEAERVGTYAQSVIASVPENGRAMVTAHDAFAYFSRAFDVDVLAVQGISTESEAGLQRIEELVDILVERRIAAVFVESSVSDRNVRALIEGAAAQGHTVTIGGEIFSDAMGAPGTYEGTWIGMLDHNATIVTRALGGTAPAGGMSGRLSAATN